MPEEKVYPSQDEDRLLWEKVGGTFHALDLARLLCILLAVVDHAGTPFGEYNVMYVQAWVLQYLYIVGGISFGLTSRSLCSYLNRLGMYFVIGIGCNLTAWIIMRMDWVHNAWNVIYQFFFVFGLMLFTFLLNPLKRWLRWVVSGRVRRFNVGWLGSFVCVAAGLLLIKILFIFVIVPLCQWAFAERLANFIGDLGTGAQYWGLPLTTEQAVLFLDEMFGILQLSISTIFLACFCPLITPKLSLVPWIMMLNLYGHRVFEFRGSEARLFNSFDMTTLGLACYYCGVAYRRIIGKYFARYYFIVLFVSALLWPAGTFKRLDEHPTLDPVLRARNTLLEALWVVVFLTAMERMVDPDIFVEDQLQYFGNWALLLFLVHKAVQIVVPVPWSWVVLFALLPLCKAMQGKKKANQSQIEGLLDATNANGQQ